MVDYIQVKDARKPKYLPMESDNTVSLETLQSAFPRACGLCFEIENKCFVVKLHRGILYPPRDWRNFATNLSLTMLNIMEMMTTTKMMMNLTTEKNMTIMTKNIMRILTRSTLNTTAKTMAMATPQKLRILTCFIITCLMKNMPMM